jgi:DNA-binding NarL/FixJ family response regulator
MYLHVRLPRICPNNLTFEGPARQLCTLRKTSPITSRKALVLLAMGTRAIVVEDDDFTRLMIVTSLRSQGLEIVLDTSEPASALESARNLKPSLAILDLHLGKGPTGVDLAVALRRDLPTIGLLMLTSYEDPRMLNPNLPKLPFGGVYLTKKSVADLSVLNQAIAKALDYKKWSSDARPLAQPISSVAELSDTQMETLRLMAKGLSNAEIAKRRFVTEKSVETAIARLAKTMGLTQDPSRNQRVHMAKVYFRALGVSVGDDD